MADRKRKRKRAVPRPPAPPQAPSARPASPPPAASESRGSMKRGYAKAELKNEAARAALQPIGPENRPRIVLVAVGWLLVACVSIVVTLITADGADANGQRLGNALMLVVVLTAAVGTYQLRTWAILGAQTLFALAFVFTILTAALLSNVLVAILLVASALISGAIFYKMINVMARVQKADHLRKAEAAATRDLD